MLTELRPPSVDLAARSALRAAATQTGYLRLVCGVASGPGWLSPVELLHPANQDRLLDLAAAGCGGAPTPAARTAAGTMLVGGIASALATPLAVLLTVQRRGLVLDAGRMRLRIGPTGVDGLALDRPDLLVLPNDPLAGLPGVRVRPDLPALRAGATESYVRVLRPVVETVRSAVRRGHRAIWAEATERLSQAIFTTLRRRGRTTEAPDAVARTLAVAPVELRHPVRWLRVPTGIDELPWKARTLCCLAYQTPRWRGEYCTTCPLVGEADSVERLGREVRSGIR